MKASNARVEVWEMKRKELLSIICTKVKDKMRELRSVECV